MPTPLRTLLLEQSTSNTELLLQQLEQCGFAPCWESVRAESDFVAALHRDWDLILAAWSAAEFPAGRAVQLLDQQPSDIPFLIVCDRAEERNVIAALKSGTGDYILRDGLGRLGWAVREGLERRRSSQETEAKRKQTELALRQSEEQYRTVVEGALEGLAIHQNGLIRFANGSAARLAGFEHAHELIGRNIWEVFVAPEARAELQARSAACLRGEPQPMHSGWPGIRKDGTRIWVQSSITVIQWHGEPAFLGYFSDITARRQAEESLRVSEERFFKAFQGSPLPVSIVTLDQGRYIDANLSLIEMVGWTRDEIIGRTAIELNMWVNPAQRAELVQQVSAHGVAKNLSAQLRMKDRALRDVLISAELIDLGGERCIIVVTQDITAQRSLEEQLRQAQKMEAVGQLAGGIAHDFNNLLTVIQGHAALLLETENCPQPTKEAAQQIALASDRAASLVRQLLTFSRRQVMQPRDLDINEVIDQTGKMLRRVLGEHIELEFHYAPAVPLIHADPGMIEQVLLNLAVNSRDAMPRGGQLIISTTTPAMDAQPVASGEMRAGRLVCITVRDTGCGIPPENLPRLFEPFFTTKGVGKGTGLGLASAYGIVKQHRGWIRVQSQVGVGTTFEVFFPASAPSRALPDPSQSTGPTVRGGEESILLVEDEASLRALVRMVLERYGYQVFEAVSGKHALALWEEQKQQIDLVLTDMVMPDGVSGQELAQELQRQRPRLKIIFTSGYSPAVLAKDLALDEGVNFLQKPYDPSMLATIVRKCLDRP